MKRATVIFEVTPRFGAGSPRACESGCDHMALLFGRPAPKRIGTCAGGICMMKYNGIKIVRDAFDAPLSGKENQP